MTRTHLILPLPRTPRTLTIHHIKVLRRPPHKVPQMIDGSLVRSGRHERLLTVASHGFMVEENTVETLLVADAIGPIFVCGVGNGHGEDVGREVGAGGCVGVGGGEWDGGHGFGRGWMDGMKGRL